MHVHVACACACACLARLPHQFQRHCRRSLLVRVEKLLGDLKRAELLVPSEDFVVLQLEGDTQQIVLYF